jgi:hypothetical protein
MLQKNLRFTNQARACRLCIWAFAWMGAVAVGCSSHGENDDDSPSSGAGTGAGSLGSAGKAGSQSGMQVGRAGQGVFRAILVLAR